MWKLENLYKAIKEQGMFEGFSECETCHVLCSRKQNIHWLLKEEAERLKEKMRISKIRDAYFFEGGLCPLLKDKRCSIYERRPLECRLNPVSIYEIDGKLYWILYTECPVVQRRKNLLMKKLKGCLKKINPFVDEEIREEFRRISEAIKSFDPLVEGRDFIRIMEV